MYVFFARPEPPARARPKGHNNKNNDNCNATTTTTTTTTNNDNNDNKGHFPAARWRQASAAFFGCHAEEQPFAGAKDGVCSILRISNPVSRFALRVGFGRCASSPRRELPEQCSLSKVLGRPRACAPRWREIFVGSVLGPERFGYAQSTYYEFSYSESLSQTFWETPYKIHWT